MHHHLGNPGQGTDGPAFGGMPGHLVPDIGHALGRGEFIGWQIALQALRPGQQVFHLGQQTRGSLRRPLLSREDVGNVPHLFTCSSHGIHLGAQLRQLAADGPGLLQHPRQLLGVLVGIRLQLMQGGSDLFDTGVQVAGQHTRLDALFRRPGQRREQTLDLIRLRGQGSDGCLFNRQGLDQGSSALVNVASRRFWRLGRLGWARDVVQSLDAVHQQDRVPLVVLTQMPKGLPFGCVPHLEQAGAHHIGIFQHLVVVPQQRGPVFLLRQGVDFVQPALIRVLGMPVSHRQARLGDDNLEVIAIALADTFHTGAVVKGAGGDVGPRFEGGPAIFVKAQICEALQRAGEPLQVVFRFGEVTRGEVEGHRDQPFLLQTLLERKLESIVGLGPASEFIIHHIAGEGGWPAQGLVHTHPGIDEQAAVGSHLLGQLKIIIDNLLCKLAAVALRLTAGQPVILLARRQIEAADDEAVGRKTTANLPQQAPILSVDEDDRRLDLLQSLAHPAHGGVFDIKPKSVHRGAPGDGGSASMLGK